MRIAISNTIFFTQRFGGISRYFINLSNEFDKRQLEYKIIAPISKNILLKKKINNKFSLYFPRFTNTSILVNLNNFLFNRYIKMFDPNILHETYYSNNIKNFKKIKVLTIYDVIHEKYSNSYLKEQIDQKKKILNYIDHFICISKHTQECFIQLYNIPLNTG